MFFLYMSNFGQIFCIINPRNSRWVFLILAQRNSGLLVSRQQQQQQQERKFLWTNRKESACLQIVLLTESGSFIVVAGVIDLRNKLMSAIIKGRVGTQSSLVLDWKLLANHRCHFKQKQQQHKTKKCT